MNTLYLTATESKSGKSAIVLGIMQLLLNNVRKAAFFRPIIDKRMDGEHDHDIDLVLKYFGLDLAYEDAYAVTLDEARDMINNDQREALFDLIIKKYKNLAGKYEFVFCEGTDFIGKDAAFEFELNADIAAALGAPVLAVINGVDKTAKDIIESAQSTLDLLNEKSIDVTACVINRAQVNDAERKEIIAKVKAREHSSYPLVTFVIPEDPRLGKPTMSDVHKWFKAKLLYGQDYMETLVDGNLIAAMQVGNFLDYLEQGQVIITPGDRLDIILACMAARLSNAYPDIAGILLTGGIPLHPAFERLVKGGNVTFPILSVATNTSQSIEMFSRLYGKIEAHDVRKINTVLGLFESCVDSKRLIKRLVDTKSEKISPKMFEYNLIERAASDKMRIVLPEAVDERILRATDILCRRKVAEIILLGDASVIGKKIAELGLEIDTTIIQPELSPKFEEYSKAYCEARKAKGISLDQARETMKDSTYFGTMMVHKGDADGMVSGAINTTAHTIRPAFEFVKTKPGISTVSSVFLMCMRDRVLVFGDCAVNPNPTASQLAAIAISSAHTAKVFGIEPRVAMLSYSTGDSGKGADVELVIEATRIAKELAPDLLLEGPIQYDAAIDEGVAKTKLPGSKVAGKATVFIFPDLNTGNNTYKAVQRAADAIAIGPVLQGLNKPVNDLSRGCTVADIINTVAITAIQAQAEKKLLNGLSK